MPQISGKKRKKLIELSAKLDPRKAFEEAMSEIDAMNSRLDEPLDEMIKYIARAKTSFDASMKQLVESLNLDDELGSVKKEYASLSSSQKKINDDMASLRQEVIEKISKASGDFEKKIIPFAGTIDKHKKTTSELIEEIRGEVRLVYSRMGGGTKPLAHFIAGVPISSRYSDLNFVQGSNVTITAVDDTTNQRVNIVVNSTGGGGGGSLTEEDAVGTVDGVNTAFTVQNLPIFIVSGGQAMINGDGFTLTGTGPYTVTFQFAPTPSTPPAQPHSFHA